MEDEEEEEEEEEMSAAKKLAEWPAITGPHWEEGWGEKKSTVI